MTGKVLIIGDKAKEGKALHDALRKQTSFTSRVSPKSDAAANFILKFNPDIIVLNPEARYSEMLDTYHMIKKEESLGEIPLILIAGEEEMKDPAIPTGLQDLFCRPLRVAECVARILILYKKTNKITDKNVIRCRDLEIDVSKYEVRVSGEKIDLTYTEYELLKFLATHPDHVFTRDVLLNKVWGYEYYGGARTVDVHVRRLRSKIEFKSKRFIDTVRNIGYKFISQEED